LAPDERARLLAALEERDKSEKDYLKTAVLVSLNTGIRKGSLLALKWDDINWSQQRVLLRAETMKAEQARTIPLNAVALEALTEWRKRTDSNAIKSPFVFPGETPNTHLGDTKKPWNNLLKKANIQHFSWHCMRHDFASQLAMMGVDINTIKELMCHESLRMTLNYAHLSPLHTAQASGRLAELYKKKG
jgi:integrase